jgi:hypothetical protein
MVRQKCLTKKPRGKTAFSQHAKLSGSGEKQDEELENEWTDDSDHSQSEDLDGEMKDELTDESMLVSSDGNDVSDNDLFEDPVSGMYLPCSL